MSSNTWISTAVASEARPLSKQAWRAVEAQHRVATMTLVDSLAEQAQLEALLDSSKPPVPAAALGLHWLLFTPFRYPTSRYGSRFRRPYDPGVFYAAYQRSTACAELGYWRWRFLTESPTLESIDTLPQTLFKVAIKGRAIDLRVAPFSREKGFQDKTDHAYCQSFAAVARAAQVDAIVYRSARDPEAGSCVAVLAPGAFAKKAPLEAETWNLSVTLERVIWQKTDVLSPEAFEFSTSLWQ
jgi:RES domain